MLLASFAPIALMQDVDVNGLLIKRLAWQKHPDKPVRVYGGLSEQSDKEVFSAAISRAHQSTHRKKPNPVGVGHIFTSGWEDGGEVDGVKNNMWHLKSQTPLAFPATGDTLPPIGDTRNLVQKEVVVGPLEKFHNALRGCMSAFAQEMQDLESETTNQSDSSNKRHDYRRETQAEEFYSDLESKRNYLSGIVKNKMDLIAAENPERYPGYDHTKQFPQFLNFDGGVRVDNHLIKFLDTLKYKNFTTKIQKDEADKRILEMALREMEALPLIRQHKNGLSSDAPKAQVQENEERLETGSGSVIKDIQQSNTKRLEALSNRADGTTSPTSVVPKEEK